MDKDLYEGICFGGPMNGEIGASRFPKGFLLVSKRTNECWIYDWNDGDQSFTARQEEPMPVMTEGEKNRYRAAEEFEYDVLAVNDGN